MNGPASPCYNAAEPMAIRKILPLIGPEAAFSVIVAAKDVARSKPAPDGYRAALAALGLGAAECLVIELDAHYGSGMGAA